VSSQTPFRWAVLALTLACSRDVQGDAGNPWLTDSDFVVAGLPDDADSAEVLAVLGEPDSIISLPDPDEPDPAAVEAAERERREAELAARREAVERTRLAAAAAAERAALQAQNRVRAVPEAERAPRRRGGANR